MWKWEAFLGLMILGSLGIGTLLIEALTPKRRAR